MIEKVTTIFNNREIATLLCIFAFLLWASVGRFGFYKSILNLLKLVIVLWKILIPMFLYIGLSIFILYRLNLWNIGLIKVTLYWFFGWAFIMLINISKIRNENGYIRNIVKEIIGLAVIISFLVDFYTFPLWVEIFFVPFTIILAGLTAMSHFYEKYQKANVFLNCTTIILGFGILGLSLCKMILNFKSFYTFTVLQEFLLPILLSFMFLPFLCILSKYLEWENKIKIAKFKQTKRSSNNFL